MRQRQSPCCDPCAVPTCRFKPEAEPQRARSSGDLPISTEDHAGQQRQYEEQQRKKDSGLLVASHPLENEPSGVLSYSTSSVSDGPSGVPRSNSNPARLSPRGKMVGLHVPRRRPAKALQHTCCSNCSLVWPCMLFSTNKMSECQGRGVCESAEEH
jgi:hypothetical protein